MTVTNQIDELILNRVNAKTSSELTSLIHTGFSSLLNDNEKDSSKKEKDEEPSNKNELIKQTIQNQAFLNKVILTNVA